MANNAQTWWDSLNDGRFVDGIGTLGWDQLGQQGQQAVNDYYTKTILPSLLGKDITGTDRLGLSQYHNEWDFGAPAQWGDNAEAAQHAGIYDSTKLDGYNGLQKLPQASLLYAIDPQLAQSLGITQDKALDWANKNNTINEAAREADDAAGAREGWLMALGTIGGGVGGAYMNGTLNAAAPAGASDAATASQLMAEYGGHGASYGGSGVGTMEGLGTAGYEAGAANAFNLGNTLGEGGLPGTLSPNSYWNPVTQSEMPYGDVGSTPMTDTPWYEKLLNNVVDTPGAASTLGKALLSFATTPTQGGGAGGMSLPGGMGGSGSGGGSGASGTSSGSTITPQQLANPQFTKWDSPLGVQYKSINPLDNSSLAQALRSY